MRLLKLPSGIYANADNINYFWVESEENTPSIEEPRKGIYCVYGVFSVKPGYMNEGATLKTGFSSKKEAEEWLNENF